MKIIGHCRFSWFGISDTGRHIENTDMAKNILWHPERMAIRFKLFESVLLPSVAAQSDQDFELVILISEAMPEIYRQRLMSLVQNIENIRVLRTSKTDIKSALRQTMVQSVSGDAKAVHFRIDDDDGLSRFFVERLHKICSSYDLEEGTAISFPKGIVCFFHDGVPKHAEYFRPYVGAGLAFVAGKNYLRNPFQVQHLRVVKRQPSFVDPTFHAFQITQHGVNTTKGYDALIHDTTEHTREINRFVKNNPELGKGAVVSAGFDDVIGKSFAPLTGPELRQSLQDTSDPAALAKHYDFI